MRNGFIFLSLGLLIFSPLISRSQDVKSSPTPGAQEKSEKNFSSSDGTLYRFESKTVWGQLNLLVRDLNYYFQVDVKSGSSASGWILKEEKTGRTISKSGLNSTNQFQFKVNQPFQGSFRTTVFLNSNRTKSLLLCVFQRTKKTSPKTPGRKGWRISRKIPIILITKWSKVFMRRLCRITPKKMSMPHWNT